MSPSMFPYDENMILILGVWKRKKKQQVLQNIQVPYFIHSDKYKTM